MMLSNRFRKLIQPTRAAKSALAIFATAAIGWTGAPASADDGLPLGDERASYSFARSIEGGVTVAAAGQGVGEALEQNQPLLTGDRVVTAPRARLELLLSDRNRLVLDGDTVVRLDQLAFSGDREARVTALTLEDGELLLEVSDEALGDELPRIETEAGTIYIQKPGSYRVATGNGAWVELLARSGYAELVTDRGSTIVRGGEMALANGDRWGQIELSRAEPEDGLERWSSQLASRAARGESSRHVGGRLSYAASSLDDSGDWVVYESVNYWRPRVSTGWRPYWQGRWAWTPSGYTWVSSEPWGWVPYHYGSWCQVHGLGWVWRPGHVYSPAWVYWHWTDGYAGWIPTGYYTNYYNPWYRGGFRYGTYGWAGGSWGFYDHWNFASVNCFRDRRYRGNYRTGRDFQHDSRLAEVPRGLITTDTRDFRPDRVGRTDEIYRGMKGGKLSNGRGELPDVTAFVGRKRELPEEIRHAIVNENPTKPSLGVELPRVASEPGWQKRDRQDRNSAPGSRNPDYEGRGGRTSAPLGDAKSALPSAPERVRSTPTPRVADGSKTDSAPRVSGTARSPRVSDDKGRMDGSPSGNSTTSGSRGTVRQAPAPSGGQQGWKERSPESSPVVRSQPAPVPKSRTEEPQGDSVRSRPRTAEPVERVISGTRRPAPSGSTDGGGSYDSKPRSQPTPAPRVYSGGEGGVSKRPEGTNRGTVSQPSSRNSAPTPRVERTPAPPATGSRTSTPAPETKAAPPPRSGAGSGSRVSSAPASRSRSSSAPKSSGSSRGNSSSNKAQSQSSSGSKKDDGDRH